MTPKQIEQINRGIAEKIGWKAEHLEYRCDGTKIIRCGACGMMGHSNCYGNGTGQLQFTCEESPCCKEAHVPDYFDERTRPQLLAALSEDEKRELIHKAVADVDAHDEFLAILNLDQPTLAKLFCAVKNIEIDL